MRIGILTGMGASAGVRFYDMIVKECQRSGASKDSDFPEIAIFNMASKGLDKHGICNEKIIKKDLEEGISILNRCGVEKILMACNTVYIYLDFLKSLSKAPIINMPQCAMDECKGKITGVICSKTSKQLGLYKVDIHCPDNLQDEVDNIIGRVISGSNTNEDRIFINSIINDMIRKGCVKVILGCTELPCAIQPNYDKDVIDPAECAIRKVLE